MQLHPVSILELKLKKKNVAHTEVWRRYQAASSPAHSQPCRLVGLQKYIYIYAILFCSWFGLGKWRVENVGLNPYRT